MSIDANTYLTESELFDLFCHETIESPVPSVDTKTELSALDRTPSDHNDIRYLGSSTAMICNLFRRASNPEDAMGVIMGQLKVLVPMIEDMRKSFREFKSAFEVVCDDDNDGPNNTIH